MNQATGECKQVNSLCKTFDPKNGICTSCYVGYEPALGTCVVNAARDTNCRKFDPMNNNYCIECYQGYLPLSGKCQGQNPLCKTANARTGVCESCWMGYTLSQGNCVLDQPTVGGQAESDIYCIKIQGNSCIECSNGYYVGSTGKCEALDPHCKSHDLKSGACLTCYEGFILRSPKCVQLVVAQIPNCDNVTPAGMCTSCIEGYFLS